MEKRKENRNLKVYSSTTGYKRKETPMIMLKGAWLQELGFDSDTPISVKCEDGKITITPREPVKEVIRTIIERDGVSRVAAHWGQTAMWST